MDKSVIFRQVKWRLGFKSPVVANLKITNKCNLNCNICSPEVRNQNYNELTTSEWKDIILNLKKRGSRVIVFEGGEPTLRNDLCELVQFSRQNNLETIVVTNGTKDFSSINPTSIWVSVDGLKDAYENIRGKNNYNKVLENINKNRYKNIALLMTLNKLNMNDIEGFTKQFKDHLILFNWMYPYKGTEHLSLTNSERKRTAKMIINLKEAGYKVFNSYKTLRNVGNQKKCYYWLIQTVDSNGSFSKNCTVETFNSTYECNKCDLSCYSEITSLYNMDYKTRKNWEDLIKIDMTFKITNFIYQQIPPRL